MYKARKGDLVQLKTGSNTVSVLADKLTFGNHDVQGACYLSGPIGGTCYWNQDDLILIRRP